MLSVGYPCQERRPHCSQVPVPRISGHASSGYLDRIFQLRLVLPTDGLSYLVLVQHVRLPPSVLLSALRMGTRKHVAHQTDIAKREAFEMTPHT